MGYIAHHAIIVTTWNKERAHLAHQQAIGIFADAVSPMVETKLNGWWSFLIAPDGSKEGWSESEDGDARRAAFMEWARHHAGYIDAVEVRYGGDEPELAEIVRPAALPHEGE